MPQPTIEQLKSLCTLGRLIFGTQDLIISGGAPRDILSGVAVKDIDVFVSIDAEQLGTVDSDFVKGCHAFAQAIRGEAVMRLSNEGYVNCFDLCDITKDGITGAVQVIGVVGNPIDDVCKYDFDLSQVFVTPGGVYGTAASWAARAAKCITFTPSATDEKAAYRSKARLGRLRAKYIGWQFANTEAIDALPEIAPEALAA